MKKYIMTIISIIFFFFFLFLFSKKNNKNNIPEQRTVVAVRAESPIQIDGKLNEKVWQKKGYSNFVQSEPHDGSEPTEKTKIWVAYDDKAIYIAGFLFDSKPQKIVGRLGRRDDFLESDWFIFAVDSYYDRRSGYQFAVNPAGSIVDWTLYNDTWNSTTWDGVWKWKTSINKKGWIVELKIPFDQLRFPKKNEYTWGVNFKRIIKRKNEENCFVWIPKEDNGYVSRFAKLKGIKNINPGLHLELLPYTVGQAQFKPVEEGNPFRTGEDFFGNAGLNLKAGILSNVTLDATINPDFGQVETDPAVINLSDFETYYSEKRPFFIEGADIFNTFGMGGSNLRFNINWASPTFFYSRRIGRTPQGSVSSDGYIDYPDRTTILGATKLTGKIGKGWNFGFINALTANEFAKIDLDGTRTREKVEPLSYYGVLRGQKEFDEGRHGLGFIATSVMRDLDTKSLEQSLSEKSFALAVDGWTFLGENKSWVVNGWFGSTKIAGSKDAISQIQKSSLHYFQRPDADHVDFDNQATSLTGMGFRLNLTKQKGNFLLSTAIGALTPSFDISDAGFQFGNADVINGHLIAGYRWPHPGKVFRNITIWGGSFRSYDFGGNKTWDGVLFIAGGEFLNYWGFNTLLAYNPDTLSETLTRGGPLALVPSGYQIDIGFNTDNRKPLILYTNTGFYNRPSEGYSFHGSINLRWKPRSNIELSVGPGYNVRDSKFQWLSNIDDPLMTDTFGTRHVFGNIFQRTLSTEIRLNWTFTPKLTLQLYMQPFIAVGKYSNFKELAEPKSFKYNVYGEGNSTIDFVEGEYIVDPDKDGPADSFSFSDPDFNYKSIRGTMVFRWEYSPGSTLYFVWTQRRADYSNPGDFSLMRDLGNVLSASGENIFLIKATYRWNM